MKTITEIILENEITNLNEGVLGKLVNWFKNLSKTQDNLFKDNKPVSFKVDTKQIKGPDKPSKLEDVTSNKEEMNLINNKQIGFPLTAEIIRNKNKYLLTDDKREYKPKVNRFFYVDGNNTYAIGYSMFDDSLSHIERYANILDLDVLANVENLSEVQKFIADKLEDDLKKTGKTGMLYVSKNPRLKAILTKQGFTTSKENKDWIIKQIK